MDLVTVSTGKHAVDTPEPGMLPGPRFTMLNPPTDDVEP